MKKTVNINMAFDMLINFEAAPKINTKIHILSFDDPLIIIIIIIIIFYRLD